MKTERILLAVAVLALLIKISGIPGGNILLLCSLAGLALAYFPLGFYFFARTEPDRHSVLVSVIGGMVWSVALYGILFKLMCWPGAAILEYLGLLSIGFCLLLYEQKRTCAPSLQAYYSQMLKRGIIVAVVSVLVLVIPRGVMNEVMPSHLEMLHRNYLRDTTDIEARERYQKYKNDLHRE